jgi:hypothetical protein
MKKFICASLTAAISSFALPVFAQFNISALSSFGGGDGWFAPGEGGYTYLGTGNLERGMAYGNGELYLVSRNGGSFIRRLDSLTGTDLGTLSLGSGIVTGGDFAVNKVAVAADGAIYVSNLRTALSDANTFKVYRWNDAAPATTPTVVYNGNPLTGARLGDSTLAVSGSGSSTRLYSGFAASPVIAGNNGYAVIDPTATAVTAVGFVGTPPNAGDFRLGVTVGPNGEIWGLQGNQTLRETSFAGASGTLLGTAANIFSAAERAMSYTVLNGVPVLATMSTGDFTVRVYDASNPLSLVLLGQKNNTTGTLSANGNATGDVAWGAVTDNGDGTTSATLYALSSNQGIQAFVVTVPEPTAAALLGIGLLGLIGRMRSRR